MLPLLVFFHGGGFVMEASTPMTPCAAPCVMQAVARSFRWITGLRRNTNFRRPLRIAGMPCTGWDVTLQHGG